MKKIAVLCALALVLVMPPAYAAVSVETFTCSGQSGTVVAENGATFSCSASLKNEDTQNSASITTVTLIVDGSWAEQASYTGTGFSASLSAGASTTATFSGIKAATPGATHKFQSVQIGSTTDTYVTNTNVNIIAIKTLTVTPSASSVAQSGEFDVEARVLAGGDLGSVALTWSGSGGCALGSGQTAAKSAGTLAHNAEATRSWRIVQGASSCVNTVTAAGTSSSVTTTSEKSATVTVAGSSSSDSSSSGGGGGGGGGGALTAETRTVKNLAVGTPASLTFTKTGITITLDAAQPAKDVSLSVAELADPGVPAPAENVHAYYNITAKNLPALAAAQITFTIDGAWLADKDVSSVTMHRYVSAWSALPTERTSDTTFSATTPGFSVFAVTASPKSSGIPASSQSQPSPEGAPVAEQPSNLPIIGDIKIPQAVFDYGPYILIIVLIVVAVAGWLHYHGPGRKLREPHYFGEKKEPKREFEYRYTADKKGKKR